MSDIDQGIKLKLTTQGDTRGSDAVANSVDRVAKNAAKANAQSKETSDANRKAADSSKDAAKGYLDQGEAMSQAAAGGRVLTEVSRGNIAALLQLGSVVKAVKAAVSSSLGVIGVVLAGVSFAIGKVQDKLAEKKENQLKLEAEKTAVAFAAAEAAADKLNQQKTDAFLARLKAIDDTAKSAVDRIQRMVDAAAKLDDVNKAVEMADIDANEGLTAEQKLDAKREINQRYNQRAENRTRQVEDTAIKAGEDQLTGAYRAEGAASRAAAAARREADANSGKTLLELMKPLEKQLAEQEKQFGKGNVRIPQLDSLRDRFAATQTDEGKARAAEAEKAAAAREGDLKNATAAREAAQKAQRDLETRTAEDRANREQLAAALARQERRQYNLDLNEARKADEAKAPRRGPTPEPLPAPPVRVTDGSDQSPVAQPTEDDRTRSRLGGLANVANAQAEAAANDPRLGEAMRELAKQAAAATKAAEGDQSQATLQEAIRLMQDLATGLAAVKTAQAEEARKTAEQMAVLKGQVQSVRR